MIPLTAAPASLVVGNAASSVCMHSGRFTMRRIILVATPSVPSEPTNTPGEIVARRVQRFRDQMHQRSVRQHDFKSQARAWS